MRAEGKELFLATFFSFAAAAMVGFFWAGREMSSESPSASPRTSAAVPRGIKLPAGIAAPSGVGLAARSDAFPSIPPSWLSLDRGDLAWGVPPTSGITPDQTGVLPGLDIPGANMGACEAHEAGDSANLDAGLQKPAYSGGINAPAESAGSSDAGRDSGAPAAAANSGELSCDETGFCRFPEWALRQASPEGMPGEEAELASGSWDAGLRGAWEQEQTPPGDREDASTLAEKAPPQSTAFESDRLAGRAGDEPPLGAGIAARPTGQGTAEVSEATDGPAKSEQTLSEESSAAATAEQGAAEATEPCPPCRCGCWPRCRRICIPRPGWVPPCGLFPYLRRLLQCPQAVPLAEGMSAGLAELADSLVALFRDVRGDAWAENRLQLEALPAVGKVAGSAPRELVKETPDFFRGKDNQGDLNPDIGRSAEGQERASSGASDPAETLRRQAAEMLAQLEGIRQQLVALGEKAESSQDGVLMRRTAHALARRLPVWQEVVAGRPFALEMAEAIEEFEAQGSPQAGARLASLIEARARTVGEDQFQHQLEEFFRNSNLRWEVSEALLNRWAKPQPVRTHRVRDYILGRPVFGEAETVSQVRFALVPDPGRLRCRLIVTGQVRGLTQSLAGPATFFDRTYGQFVGWKEIELTERGLHISAPQVRAQQRVELRGLRTDFDGIPLLGAIAHEIALAQRERSMPEANAEARQKLVARITQQFEAEASPRLARLEELVDRRLLRPATRLGLQPTIIQASTFEDRLVARWRLADYNQLGANTPRPRLPQNILASFQIHESAVNNVLAKLELAGRTFTPTQLQAQLAQLLDWPELVNSDYEREDVTICFAKADPVLVHFSDGRVTIELQVARLEKAPHVWENFRVRVSYRPETVNGQAAFVRDGVVSLTGESLSLKDQLALRGIFSKRFSKEKTWPVLPKLFRESPEFADVRLCHLVLDDGWFSWAVAAGGDRPSEQPRPLLERFATADGCRTG